MHLMRGGLLDASPLSVEGERVVIGLDPEFETDRAMFETVRSRNCLEHVVGHILRRKVSVTFQFVERKADLEPAAVGADVEAAEGPAVAVEAHPVELPVEPAVESQPNLLPRMWEDDPAVKLVMEFFQSRIVDVKQ